MQFSPPTNPILNDAQVAILVLHGAALKVILGLAYKGAGYGHVAIPKAIEYGCVARPSSAPYIPGAFPYYVVGQSLQLGRCLLFLELLGDPPKCLTVGYWVLLTLRLYFVG
jgi:hypothetical protein